MATTFSLKTNGSGLYEFTDKVINIVSNSGIDEGLCTVFVQHTSASLVIQENADPTAREDLERWLNRLVPDESGFFSHTSEGLDDMPSHVKAALTQTSLGIPVTEGRLALGTWQGIYLWEHRSDRHTRSIVISILGG